MQPPWAAGPQLEGPRPDAVATQVSCSRRPAARGVRVPGTWKFDGGWAAGQAPSVGTRVIVKPMYESQSIGIGDDSIRVADVDFEAFLRDRLVRFAQPAVVQEFVLRRRGSVFRSPASATRRTRGCPMAYRQSDGTLFDPPAEDVRRREREAQRPSCAAQGSRTTGRGAG